MDISRLLPVTCFRELLLFLIIVSNHVGVSSRSINSRYIGFTCKLLTDLSWVCLCPQRNVVLALGESTGIFIVCDSHFHFHFMETFGFTALSSAFGRRKRSSDQYSKSSKKIMKNSPEFLIKCKMTHGFTWLCLCPEKSVVLILDDSRDFFIVCDSEGKMTLMKSASYRRVQETGQMVKTYSEDDINDDDDNEHLHSDNDDLEQLEENIRRTENRNGYHGQSSSGYDVNDEEEGQDFNTFLDNVPPKESQIFKEDQNYDTSATEESENLLPSKTQTITQSESTKQNSTSVVTTQPNTTERLTTQPLTTTIVTTQSPTTTRLTTQPPTTTKLTTQSPTTTRFTTQPQTTTKLTTQPFTTTRLTTQPQTTTRLTTQPFTTTRLTTLPLATTIFTTQPPKTTKLTTLPHTTTRLTIHPPPPTTTHSITKKTTHAEMKPFKEDSVRSHVPQNGDNEPSTSHSYKNFLLYLNRNTSVSESKSNEVNDNAQTTTTTTTKSTASVAASHQPGVFCSFMGRKILPNNFFQPGPYACKMICLPDGTMIRQCPRSG